MTTPMSSRPTSESTGARTVPIGPTPYGSPVRGGRGRAARVTRPTPTSPGDRRREHAAASGWAPLARRVADLELERLEPAERAAGQARDDVDDVALLDERSDVEPPEGDPVEHVPFASQGQRRVVGRRPGAPG